MTVTYSYEASNAGFFTPLRLLLKWRGSVLKYVWRELVLYLLSYAAISAVYRFALGEDGRKTFEALVIFCDHYTTMIPTTFILGFYVNIVFTRWNSIFASIAWPDEVCLFLATYLRGKDDRSRLLRRTVARYLIAAEVLTLRDISMSVRKRFPTLQHVSDAGDEMTSAIEACCRGTSCSCSSPWTARTKSTGCPSSGPWASSASPRTKARSPPTSSCTRSTRCAPSPPLPKHATGSKAVMSFRSKLGTLLCYDSVCIPLVYTQIVWLAVWTYFAAALISRQYLDPSAGYPRYQADLVFPPFLFLQFVFFMGWLKVAECMLNPLGEDDDDFELNSIIDRNLQVALMQLDDNASVVPELRQDPFWDTDVPDLPHTVASWGLSDHPLKPSCSHKDIAPKGARVLNEAELSRRESRRSRFGGSNWTVATRRLSSKRGGPNPDAETAAARGPAKKRSVSDNGMGGVTRAEPRDFAVEALPDKFLFALAEETPAQRL